LPLPVIAGHRGTRATCGSLFVRRFRAGFTEWYRPNTLQRGLVNYIRP
jgi:hypothetical protein